MPRPTPLLCIFAGVYRAYIRTGKICEALWDFVDNSETIDNGRADEQGRAGEYAAGGARASGVSCVRVCQAGLAWGQSIRHHSGSHGCQNDDTRMTESCPGDAAAVSAGLPLRAWANVRMCTCVDASWHTCARRHIHTQAQSTCSLASSRILSFAF
jgi:hypothetical protein